MQKLFVFQTRIGPFYIVRIKDRFHPYFDGETLGSYINPEQAVDDLAGGHTFSIRGGVDTSSLGIPDDLSEWERFTADHDDGY